MGTMKAVDLFAGPGGWDVAARQLGVDVTGIELNKDARATRAAAGLVTSGIADVTRYVPSADDRLLIASPPCPTFSMAGDGSGRAELHSVAAEMSRMKWLPRHGGTPAFSDPRTALSLEPWRWILEAHSLGHPFDFIAMEQVPPVLPLWQAYVDGLRGMGSIAQHIGRERL